MKYFLIFIGILISFPVYSVFATSGACSNHGGVMCSAGPDSDGSAICNDGWRDSTTDFSETAECFPTPNSCPSYYEHREYTTLVDKLQDLIDSTEKDTKNICEGVLSRSSSITEQYYQSCLNLNQQRKNVYGMAGAPVTGLKDCESEKVARESQDKGNYNVCLSSDFSTVSKYKTMLSCTAEYKEPSVYIEPVAEIKPIETTAKTQKSLIDTLFPQGTDQKVSEKPTTKIFQSVSKEKTEKVDKNDQEIKPVENVVSETNTSTLKQSGWKKFKSFILKFKFW